MRAFPAELHVGAPRHLAVNFIRWMGRLRLQTQIQLPTCSQISWVLSSVSSVVWLGLFAQRPKPLASGRYAMRPQGLAEAMLRSR